MKRSRFEGRCDVCKQKISLEHDTREGIIDMGITDFGTPYTWIRHYATAPEGANPDCAVGRVIPKKAPRSMIHSSSILF